MSLVFQRLSVVVLCFLFASAHYLRIHAVQSSASTAHSSESYYLPPSIWIKFFSCGFTEAASILLWSRALVYQGEHLASESIEEATRTKSSSVQPSFLSRYLDVVTDLNPRFHRAFAQGVVLVTVSDQQISRDVVEKAIALTKKGLVQFPDDHRLAFHLAFLYYYEIQPFVSTSDGGKEKSYYTAEGLHWYRKAALFARSSEDTQGSLSSTLMAKEGMEEAVVEHLQYLLLQVTDPLQRRALELQYIKAVGELAPKDINYTLGLQAKWQKRSPFIPFDLYLLLYERESLDSAYALNALADDESLFLTDPQGQPVN